MGGGGWRNACGVPYLCISGVMCTPCGDPVAVLVSRASYILWYCSGVWGRRYEGCSEGLGFILGEAWALGAYGGPETPPDVDGGPKDGPGGSRDWEGPPSIEDIDMELPPLVVLGSDPSAGSSRPPGKATGGPTETGGGRGGGNPYEPPLPICPPGPGTGP